jgi:hypothetical protein
MPSVEAPDDNAKQEPAAEPTTQDRSLTVAEWGQGQWFRDQDGKRWFFLYGPLTSERPTQLSGRQVHTRDGQDLFFTRDGRLFRALSSQPLSTTNPLPLQQRLPVLPGLADPSALLQR